MPEQPTPGDDAPPDPVIVTMQFDAPEVAGFAAALSRYVVLSRNHEGCINIDLAASATTPGRYVVISKWSTPAAQRAHLDSPELVALAEEARASLQTAPLIDLLEPISAHDLR